jgi:opacity protein-like surface antigen
VKKLGSLIVCMFLGAGLTLGQTRERIRILPDEEKYFSIGLQAGAFFSQDVDLQELYGKSIPFFGPEMTLRLPISDPHGLDLAVGGRLLKANGRTSYTQEATSLRLTSLSVAVRYSYDTGRFAIILGPGMDYVMYKETYAETFPVPFASGNTVGFNIQGTVLLHLTSGLSIKGYGKYCGASTEDPGFRVNLGGAEWGAGVLYRFHF